MSEPWTAMMAGVIALLVVLWFRPGISEALKRSREAENPDWQGALVPIGAVVLFVILLLWLA